MAEETIRQYVDKGDKREGDGITKTVLQLASPQKKKLILGGKRHKHIVHSFFEGAYPIFRNQTPAI